MVKWTIKLFIRQFMRTIRNIVTSTLLGVVVLLSTAQVSYAASPEVKKSNSGICHDDSSGSYSRTKNFTPFDTISACINSGGRLPKGATRQIDKATKEADAEGRAYSNVYNRKDWPHWSDSDRDCQDTRHETLIDHSKISVSFKTSKKCNVMQGKWYDPYSGDTYTTAKDLDLDHIVPLKFAHTHGGDKFSRDKREKFANDPDNLLLVDLSLNRQKGAKGPTEWMPPYQSYRCEYIIRFDFVMTKYGLQYTSAETRILNRMRNACGF
jgi:hypothetical protein